MRDAVHVLYSTQVGL